MALKKDPVEIEKKTPEDNLNYAANKMAVLSKSRITQLLQLKEEAIAKGDNDKVKEIESELFLLRD
jgi:hypothetical protein|tara:strand:- start:408 stop:605 length:198 start_codon:yes stop_codon:yes gene_type:complete